MNKELELWQFIAERLGRNEPAILLVVAESSGSSPGRQGYKMGVGVDGALCGSIGGGVMEVNLVEQSRAILSELCAGSLSDERSGPHVTNGVTLKADLKELVHRKGVPNSSGMICSGKQAVIFKLFTPENIEIVHTIIDALKSRWLTVLRISPTEFSISPPAGGTSNDFLFEKQTETDFVYSEQLGFKNHLCIIGGGHCALALSELMSKMDFHISIFDDRPGLNTIGKNNFAHEVKIIESYDRIADSVPSGQSVYVVVMTLGYKSDETVIRAMIEKELKYFGVLGSKAKMAALIKALIAEGFDEKRLERIHTPIGLRINSRTPEEIAISIAAEIISVKNA